MEGPKCECMDIIWLTHSVHCRTGCNKGRQELKYQHFASFTLTLEDAQKYLYSFSTRKRVLGWKDIEVNLYI